MGVGRVSTRLLSKLCLQKNHQTQKSQQIRWLSIFSRHHAKRQGLRYSGLATIQRWRKLRYGLHSAQQPCTA